MIVLLNTLEAWLLGLGIILGVAVILFVIFYFVSGFRKKEANSSWQQSYLQERCTHTQIDAYSHNKQ